MIQKVFIVLVFVLPILFLFGCLQPDSSNLSDSSSDLNNNADGSSVIANNSQIYLPIPLEGCLSMCLAIDNNFSDCQIKCDESNYG